MLAARPIHVCPLSSTKPPCWRRNLEAVTQQCFHDALDKILLGAERSLVLSEADVNVIAYHEGGHALKGWAVARVLMAK
jgi:ATP-dependent Zn protease